MPRKPPTALPAPRADGALGAPADPGGPELSPEILASIHSMFKKLDNAARGANVKLALAQRKALGQVAGQIPYGWTRDGDSVIEHPAEQAAIRRMLQLRAAGKTTYRIALTLADEGHPARGARWYPQSVQNILDGADLRAADPGTKP